MRRLAILIVLSVLRLKSELLPIRTYTTADGLAADHIDCIVSDSRGFLWFCTPEGLSRFDSNHFVSYGLNEGLPHQSVSAFLDTRSGDHWIGTPGGLVRINSGSHGAPFTTYRLGQEAKQNLITALLEARSGQIWCATVAGLFKWRTPLGFGREELPIPPMITDLVESPGGDLWFGTLGGFSSLEKTALCITLP
jgi:ligand-binding sensor domain-containing protein